jgi:hypothetical protein
LRYTIDRRARVFHLDLNRPVSAHRALEQSLALLAAEPELWGWDWIVDARTVPEDASIEQIARLATVFAAQPAAPAEALATTVLVSEDRYLHLWAKVMDFQFPRRKHLVVTDVAQAFRLIEARQAAT